MNKHLLTYSAKINDLTFRERSLAMISIVVLLGFAWWNAYGQPIQAETKQLNKQNEALVQEILVLESTSQSIEKRIDGGILNAKQRQLENLQDELNRVKNLLDEKLLDLIEPDEMFQLMRELIFAESKLKLTGLKRKRVAPVFSENEKAGEEKGEDQPEIYRHVMEMKFEGTYLNILSYLSRLEKIEWKLIWDRLSLRIEEYPVINVEIEISTLSDNKHWVGL